MAIAAEDISHVLPNNCFPDDEMRKEYLDNIKNRSDDEFVFLLRRLLVRHRSYGVDARTLEGILRAPNLKSLMSIEFVRKLFIGEPWDGNSWVIDLLPTRPADAIQVIRSYIIAHNFWFADNMYYGHLDAIEVIRARYNVHVMHSTFISYGAPDEAFAARLCDVLNANNVTAFFFREHAKPGEKLHRLMRKGIVEHDRVVLICSRASLNRKGVLAELEETLAREHRDAQEYLIPIRLDDYVLKDWAPKNPDVAQAVRDRVVADFTGADQDEDKFQAGLRRLLAALRK